jgi:hypothetical protein
VKNDIFSGMRDELAATEAERASLAAEVAEALPWVMFYRDGKTLKEIAEATGESIYAYSPILTAPLTANIMEFAEGRAAARAEAQALRDALTLARNRLQYCVLDMPFESRRRYETAEWADEATAALAPHPHTPEEPRRAE